MRLTPEAIDKSLVRRVVAAWLAAGTKESTVVSRLNCLSAIGVNVTGCRPTIPRKLKWWLSPDEEARLLPWLRSHVNPRFKLLADYIEWATKTGCRIEETLALEWRDVHFKPGRTLITVPGLKTHSAQATLPISDDATAILRRRKEAGEAKPFDISYRNLQHAWKEARSFLGLADPYTATLKAFRRNAARSLHVSKGMPLDMVRQYLRHENVETTMGYLRLTGGYGEEEMGKWL